MLEHYYNLTSSTFMKKKIMRATTDSEPAVNYESAGAGIRNLLNIFQAFSGWDEDAMRREFDGQRYGDTKKKVAEMVVASLEPIQQRYREVTADPGYIDGVLEASAQRVEPIADGTIELVKKKMGLYTRS